MEFVKKFEELVNEAVYHDSELEERNKFLLFSQGNYKKRLDELEAVPSSDITSDISQEAYLIKMQLDKVGRELKENHDSRVDALKNKGVELSKCFDEIKQEAKGIKGYRKLGLEYREAFQQLRNGGEVFSESMKKLEHVASGIELSYSDIGFRYLFLNDRDIFAIDTTGRTVM